MGLKGIKHLELRHILPLMLAVLVFLTGWSVWAAPNDVDYCSQGGLALKIDLLTDNGVTQYKQQLELSLTGGDRYSGRVRSVHIKQELPIRSAHCRAWMKTVGHQIPNLLAAMKSNRGPANQACEKWGRVEVTYESRGAQQSQLKKDSAVVCFQLNAPSTNQAVTSFRKLYESAELFVSAP